MIFINLFSNLLLLIGISNVNGDLLPNNGYGCMVDRGYSWCDSLEECINEWESPCPDNYVNCYDCLKRERNGENIACPLYCNNYIPQEIPEVNNVAGISNNEKEDCTINPIACNNLYVCPKVTEVTHCSQGGIDGYTTYQLSVIIQPNMNSKNIYAIYGSQDHNMYWPEAYHIDGPFNSDIGGISPSIIDIFPDAKFDSWITIGITDGDPRNKLSTIGIDFNTWSEDSSVLTSDGAVFLMDPREIISHEEYIIAQLTIPNNIMKIMTVNIQGETYSDSVNKQTWTEDGVEFILYPRGLDIADNIPPGCNIWYDGCNLCPIINGELGVCTRNMCLTTDEPECRLYDNSGH